ncbi:MAG: phospholipid-binding protein MlaC [Gammaproteobacteria bacterium]
MNLRVVTTPLLLISLVLTTAHAAMPGADEIVRTTADKVIERLNAEKQDLDAHPEHLYSLIQELIVPHFDTAIMSRWILGKDWKKATREQRQEFSRQFTNLMVRTYAKALLEYSDEEIRYLPLEVNPNSNLVMVKTEVSSDGGSVVPINYRMHVSGGDWKVIDVSVDGVSLVGTYRGSFASEIRKNGLDGLIQKLADRNQRLASSEGE